MSANAVDIIVTTIIVVTVYLGLCFLILALFRASGDYNERQDEIQKNFEVKIEKDVDDKNPIK
jgi:hypothetical protein